MVNLLEKLFGSFFSAITSFCVFQYHHPHHQQGTNKHKMTKARPLSLQVLNQFF